MKKIEFETSKGKFVLIDLPSYEEIEKELEIFGHDQGLTNDDLNYYFRHILPDFNKSYELSEITEEQASDIVFRIGHHSNGHLIPSAVELLHSLLKSKGIHLFENPYHDAGLIPSYEQKLYREAKQKTFYNPYIFKL